MNDHLCATEHPATSVIYRKKHKLEKYGFMRFSLRVRAREKYSDAALWVVALIPSLSHLLPANAAHAATLLLLLLLLQSDSESESESQTVCWCQQIWRMSASFHPKLQSPSGKRRWIRKENQKQQAARKTAARERERWIWRSNYKDGPWNRYTVSRATHTMHCEKIVQYKQVDFWREFGCDWYEIWYVAGRFRNANISK